MDIPASVEEIGSGAFTGCSWLRKVIFATDGRLKRINGFRMCGSLSRLEIPASVEKIDVSAAHLDPRSEVQESLLRRELIFRPGTRLGPNAKNISFRAFVIFEDANDLKRHRRQVHVHNQPYVGSMT
jgi:hypothetical protein